MPDGRGAFFAIDAVAWRQALTLGLNPACAFLVLAAGTGRGQRRTTWSVHAVENYAGIGRQRAAAAIGELVGADLARIMRGGARPVYDLGRLIQDDAEPPEQVWMPISIVTGEPGTVPRASPLALLRATGRADLLAILVDLYQHHDLPNEGGLDRRMCSWRYSGRRLAERGAWVVWGFAPVHLTASTSWPPAARFVTGSTGPDGRDAGAPDFWSAIDTLVQLGLAEWVPCLCEAAYHGEIIHALSDGGGLQIEQEAFSAARQAALALLPARAAREFAESNHILIPVPRALGEVTVAGILRLVHRPDTTATRAWLAKSFALADNVAAYQEITDAVKRQNCRPRLAAG